MSEFIPATTGLSRVFIIDGRAGPENLQEYFSCLRAQAVSQAFGDITNIECPDPTRPGAYVVVGSFQSGEERATVTLEGRYALDLRSRLLRMARNKCPVDVQVHFGDCEDLSDPNSFKKVLFLEDCLLSSYNTEDLGSLSDADTAAVNESVEVSAAQIYDIIPHTWAEKAGDLATTEVVAAVVCDEVSCGDCGAPSGGCEKIFAVTLLAGGSPGTPPDVLYSLDGGITWYAHDIETLGAAMDPNDVACLKGQLVVVSADYVGAAIADLDDFDEFGTDPDFDGVAAGFVGGHGPTCITKRLATRAYIGGEAGYIYLMTTPENGVTVLEDGALTISDLRDIDALSENFVVAVGNDGVILYSEDGETFQLLTTAPVGVGVDLYCVFVKSKLEWWVGGDNGNLYYTLDGGAHWTQKEFVGDGAGTVVQDIEFATDSIAYMAHTTAAPLGRILCSFNGGYDWEVMPLGTALMPDADRFNQVAVCRADPELVVPVGLAGDGADGIVVIGTM